jgi:hypothetical protein
MDMVVIHHDIDALALRGWIGVVQALPQLPAQPIGLAQPTARVQGPC